MTFDREAFSLAVASASRHAAREGKVIHHMSWYNDIGHLSYMMRKPARAEPEPDPPKSGRGVQEMLL